MNSPAVSIRSRVTATILGAIATSLVLVAIGIGLYEYRAAETRLRTTLELISDTMLFGSVSAVDFGVPEAAREILSSVHRARSVKATALYHYPSGADGGPEIFARYDVPGAEFQFESTQRPDGFYTEGDSGLLVTTFRRDGRPVATLTIEGSLTSVRRNIGESLRVLSLIFVGLGAVGAVAAWVLQRSITEPVLTLAQTASSVRSSGDYGLRFQVKTEDELGQLGHRFNEMLAGIEERERRLTATRAFQNAILERSGVAIISTDEKGIVVTFNPAAEQLLGYRVEDVVGRHTPALWHDPEEIARRAQELTEERGRSISADFEVFKAGGKNGQADRREWTYVCRDGRRVPVFLVVSALRDTAGTTFGYCGLATDLSERKAAEAALMESERRYGVVIEQTGQMVYDIDLITGAAHWFGESAVRAITGFTYTEFQAVTLAGWTDLIHPDDRAATIANFDRCAATGERFDAVYRFLRKDGEYRMIQDFGVFLRNGEGRVVRMLGAMSDVTERHAAESAIRRLNTELEQRVEERTAELARRVAQVEQLNAEQQDLMRSLSSSQQAADRVAARLQQANANLLTVNSELESFSYSVSHDLRAPLRNITGFLELLAKRSTGRLDVESERFIKIVVSEAGRMGMLIDDLLTFSRIGRTEMNLQPVQLEGLLEEVRVELQPEIEGRAIEWRISSLPTVKGDRTLLRQVMANLIDNALKFTRRRNEAVIEVGVSAGRPGDTMATFYVRDNGAGFNPKYIDKLFGVFQRLHNVHDFDGTGIGLANVKRIVVRHGGRVWAEGALDKGAVFYFVLPVTEPWPGSAP